MRSLLLIFFSLFVLNINNINANGSIATHPSSDLIAVSGEELIYLLEGRIDSIDGKPTKLLIVLYGKDANVLESVIREISILPPPLIKRRIEEKLARGSLEKIEIKSSVLEAFQSVMRDTNAITLSNENTDQMADIIGLKLVPIIN